MGAGGGDLCVELKAWNPLVLTTASSEAETSFQGDTHAFGNTEERLIRRVMGVKQRDAAARWSPSLGTGAVSAHRGDYHDAIWTKRNTVRMVGHSIFGGFMPGAVAHLRSLAKRSLDRTVYESWAAPSFVAHWAQRISAAIVTADSRRCLRRLPELRRRAAAAAQRAARRRPVQA